MNRALLICLIIVVIELVTTFSSKSMAYDYAHQGNQVANGRQTAQQIQQAVRQPMYYSDEKLQADRIEAELKESNNLLRDQINQDHEFIEEQRLQNEINEK